MGIHRRRMIGRNMSRKQARRQRPRPDVKSASNLFGRHPREASSLTNQAYYRSVSVVGRCKARS